TRVIPARLLGHKAESGGKVELLLVRRLGEATVRHEGRDLPAETWRALGRSSKPLRPGARVSFDGGALAAEIAAQPADGLLEVHLFSPAGLPLDAALESTGHVPLPPYLHRP